MKLRLISSIAAFLFALTCVFVAGLSAPPNAGADAPLLPIIFVHGGAGSGAQYETQAMRFESNGYPVDYIYVLEYDSTFVTNTVPQVYAKLDQLITDVQAETGAAQVGLLAHSLGTSLMVNYLNSSPLRSAGVAKYVNIDGATGANCPGNPLPVNCLGIFGQGAPGRAMGTNNVYFPDQSHTQTVTSEQSFAAQYEFLTGKAPVTTLVLPEPPGQVEIAGKLVNFPVNAGVNGGTIEIWEVHGNSGVRKDSFPMAIINIGPTGEWGPIHVNGQKYYEFAATRPDSPRITHFYRQPFIRSDYLIRLLSSPPTSPIIINTATGPDHSAAVLIRYKEWWSDQGAGSDTIWVTTTSPTWASNPNYPPTLNILSNPAVAPRLPIIPFSPNKIGIHAFDAGPDLNHPTIGPDKVSTLAPIPFFLSQTFQTGVDIWMPATDPPDGTISFTNEPRGDTSRPQTVNVRNWASDDHRISIQFNDYVQDINTWGECKRAKPSPCK